MSPSQGPLLHVGLGGPTLLLLLSLLTTACARTPRDLRDSIAPATERGLACLASTYDGNTFDDEYLKYVYPEERLVSPLPGYRVTYRNLDAYFIVLMIRQAGADAGAARVLFERADALAAALVPAWRREGLYNVRRNAVAGGIALDTYAILAYLKRDPEMARTILAALDGDGWLASNYYRGTQVFRMVADESWAARALVVTGVDPAAAESAVRSVCEAARARLGRETGALARANLALHALDAIRDLHASDESREIEWLPGDRAFFVAEARRSTADREVGSNTLTLANLAGSLAREPSVESEALEPIVRDLIERQDPDGCWRDALDASGDAARVFATARMILLLQVYRTVRLRAGS